MNFRNNAAYLFNFFKMESAGGIVLMFAALSAIILANSPLQVYYNRLIEIPVVFSVGNFEIAKPLLLWINDGLMSVFFFLVGLELKREVMEGELSDAKSILLPAAGALGGMLVPSLIYIIFNYGDEIAMQGWAIPAATDIAFALGILSLLGSRVPNGIKVFLTTVAIFDDLGAIVIIAIFYTTNISWSALTLVLMCLPVLYYLNKRGVTANSVYLMIGTIMWIAMLKSGAHATITGVIVALFIPLKSIKDPEISPLKNLEDDLHSAVAFFVLPVFAFANAGIGLLNLSAEQLFHPVPMGITFGLFIGKQIGIWGICVIVIKLGLTNLPSGMSWKTLYGTAALCGVGFTMSLFIGSLAFQETGTTLLFDERLGIILGSLLSGFLGYIILKSSLNQKQGPI